MSKKDNIKGLLKRKSEENTADNNIAKQQLLNTGIQETVNTVKKKATFEMDPQLHKELKMYATQNDKSMVDVVEAALREYMRK